jgi:hypothetical protein
MENEEVTPADEPSLFDQPDGVDWFLANQVHLADAYGIEQGITLNVGGVLVSGMLIGGRKYFQELSDQIRRVTAGTASEGYGELMGDTHSAFVEVYPERQPDQPYPYRRINYIHLRGALTFGSNGIMSPREGVYWRGKLSSVDGYSFGNLSQS